MSYFNKVKIEDADGNVIGSNQDQSGKYYLGSSIIQDIDSSENNFFTGSLAVGASWTGSADEAFGINGIQLYHASDQDCTIYVDQSVYSDFSESIFIVKDEQPCLANQVVTRTFQSVAPYYRIRIVNTGIDTTTKMMMMTGMTPIINPLPRKLSHGSNDAAGRLDTETTIRDQQIHRHVGVSPTNELQVVERNRLVGKSFVGNTTTQTSTHQVQMQLGILILRVT